MSATHPQIQQQQRFSFGINTTTPPPLDPQVIMQRADEVNTIQRMIIDRQSSAVMLIGNPGAGKTSLAALLYNRLLLAKQRNMPAPYHLVWLSIGAYTTLPDLIAAILRGVEMYDPTLFLQSPEEQISSLLQALRRPQENALIILDQFESMLYPETDMGAEGRGVISLFLDMLQKDLGASRFLLTNYSFPYDEHMEESRVRSYLVSRISIPEGVALLQQLGITSSPEELSLIWQRCTGQVFDLVLFSALVRLSGISASHFLSASNYHGLWRGEVTPNLIAGIYHSLNSVQTAIVRALCLFSEPVPLQGIIMTATGSSASATDPHSRPHAIFESELNILLKLYLIQITIDQTGYTCYSLHPWLRQYVLEHYLEEKQQDPGAELVALGINLLQPALPNGPEALQSSITAGYIQVAAYYQYIAHEYYPLRELRRGLHDIEPLITAVRYLSLGWHWQKACDLLFTEGLHENMVQWGAWNALLGLYTSLLPPVGSLYKRDEALICSHVSMLYGRLGMKKLCQSYFEQALTIQREIGDIQGEAATLGNQAELLRMQGEFDKARIHFEQVLSLAQQQDDLRLQCVMLHNLGLIYHSMKDYKQAFSYYLEALRLGYNLREQHSRGMILTNMGMLLYEEGLQKEAMAVLLSALQHRRGLQDPTVILLENFLDAVEQRMGAEAYAHLCQDALGIQHHVFARFGNADMRH
jgi:tetratricopeptide (TPR) repeat protein